MMTTDASSGPIARRIHDCYAQLHPAERRLADVILNLPAELAGYTASELAQLAGTSNAAVSRLIQRLGFESYEAMRLLSRETTSRGSPLDLMKRSKGAGHQPIARHVAATIDSVQRTFTTDIDGLVDNLAESICNARRVWLIGWRHSHFLAGYLHWQLLHARSDVHLLPRAGGTAGESAVDIGAEDAVIAIALRRRPKAISQWIGLAKKSGAKVAVVADLGYIDEHKANWVMRCDTRSSAAIDNHTSAFLFCHVLVERVIMKAGVGGRKRFARIDDLHVKFEEL